MSEFGLGTALIVKADGGTTYLLRDLATYLFRKHDKHFTKQVYVVDNRQSHHFRQLFKVLQILEEWREGEGVHVDFGFMSLPEGVFSTRKGNIIELEELVTKTIEKARAVISEKNPLLKNADLVAKDVAVGALKYFDLSRNRRSDVVFSWDKALNFEGHTGPYIQYSYVRIKSILRKAAATIQPMRDFRFEHEEELKLLRLLAQFISRLDDAQGSYSPNLLADYLYRLASELNNYYQKVRILEEENDRLRISRLSLIAGIAQVLRSGLYLMGISAPEEM